MARLPNTLRELVKRIGPGIVTGASDDDPSGIVTYAQVGATAGTELLWVAPLVTPFMIAIQEMCARIGIVTGHGLVGNLVRSKIPKHLLIILACTVFIANTINIGADLAGMAAAANLLVPGVPEWIFSAVFALTVCAFMIFSSYPKFASIMKWLTLPMLVYVLTPLALQIDWPVVLRHSFIPQLRFNRETLLLVVAALGTTISPYLFFWQADMEVEDKKDRLKRFLRSWIVTKHEIRLMETDITLGMVLSNLVMWFIALTTALTLFPNGISIQTAREAAEALRPLVGEFSYTIFTLGIIGTGMLAIPVLAGSSSYALTEALKWRGSINSSFQRASRFYLIIILSTLIGVIMPILRIDPIRALLLTAVLYGILSPFLIATVLAIANNKKVMGRYKNSPLTNFFGITTFVFMSTAAILLIALSIR